MMLSDTIAAVATPPGEGGVGMVRVSGPLSGALPPRLFPALRQPWITHRMRHGRLVDPSSGRTIDHAMACLMATPNSYTGEDVFEIHAHGSPLVLERILALCLAEGCRTAQPGEFTLRAFLNGRLDLTQAEAVLDVVRARGNASLELAVEQMGGWLGEKIEPARQTLIGVAAHMEAMVDFVEEDISPQVDEVMRAGLAETLGTIEALLAGARQGIVLREGALLAIVGPPNAGKSSIMNGLLGLERSIVTEVPGTTRDTVEETLQIRGVPFRTIDTAGITETVDVVESIGVERSRRAIGGADVILLVLDRSRPLAAGDEPALCVVEEARSGADGRTTRLVLALNKSDLPCGLDPQPIVTRLRPHMVVESNALSAGGLEALRSALEGAALGQTRHEHVVGNVRHQDALQRAGESIRAALSGSSRGIPLDLISLDVRAAAQLLGEITGACVDDELLDRIFRDFCIGK